MSTKVSQVLFLVFVMWLQSQIALTKAMSHKFQTLEPILDTSLVPKPSHFTLRIKHTQVVFPKDPTVMLHGKTRVVDLSAEENKDVLRGRVAEEKRDSIINTREYGVKPQFHVDLRKLEAKYAPDMAHLMDTELATARRKSAAEVALQEPLMEQELRSRPPLPELPVPRSKANPDESKSFELKLEQTRQNEQQAKHLIPQLEAALHAQEHGNKMPPLPNKPVAVPLDRVTLPDRSIPPVPKPDIASAEQKMSQELASANLPVPAVPASPKVTPVQAKKQIPFIPLQVPIMAPNNQVPSLPAIKQTPAIPINKQGPVIPGNNPNRLPVSIPSVPKIDTSATEQQMTAEMLKANQPVPDPVPSLKGKLQVPSEAELHGKLELAAKQAKAAVKNAQPAMDTILTSLRANPPFHMPAASNPEPAVEDDVVSTIKWDEWHAKFAELARDPILKNVSKTGNPSGVNTVEISVSPSQHVVVRLVQSGNDSFDQAILQAYRSLDGNPALKYPAGSRRSSITFLIDNKHSTTGVPSSVTSQTSIGDKEFFHRGR